jgi:hypothetical protein
LPRIEQRFSTPEKALDINNVNITYHVIRAWSSDSNTDSVRVYGGSF